MDDYRFLNIPDSCFVGSTIYKKLFYENAHLSSSDKSLFTDTINKVVWLYCLKPETINILNIFKIIYLDFKLYFVINIKCRRFSRKEKTRQGIHVTLNFIFRVRRKSMNSLGLNTP